MQPSVQLPAPAEESSLTLHGRLATRAASIQMQSTTLPARGPILSPDPDHLAKTGATPGSSAARRATPETIALMIESDEPGGAEIMLLETADELRRRGHRVVPVLPDRGVGWLGEEFVKRGYRYSTFSIRRPLDPQCLRGLIRLLRAEQVDVVHSHEFTMAVYGTAAAAWLRKPHVITWHGSQTHMEAYRRRAALRWAYRNSRAVVAVSRSTEAHMRERLGVAPPNLTTIPNGIHFRPGTREVVRQELGLSPDDLLIAAVGSLVPRKGHLILLQALAALPENAAAQPWRVAIAGGGTELDRLREFAAAAGIADRVHLLGHRDDVPNILAAADVFAMPSFWEGLPVAMQEAMFAGLPVVATDVSGIPEGLTPPDEGFLVPPGDVPALSAALAGVLTDADLRDRIGRNGRKRAEANFTVGVMVDQYLKAYGVAQ